MKKYLHFRQLMLKKRNTFESNKSISKKLGPDAVFHSEVT